ncbi:hypothetical protein [Paludisphaera mucosa]|uniref:Uncharacterized protein n=1 Tax=Paludisphaera mucosa TaxID=3030827 RepID=A0ABT6F6N6_9BACT|nr:hypothetical protein [Paludisphaera mucosa]MDG3003248.1 hypothetical protein [Paludisphaera mucosa]
MALVGPHYHAETVTTFPAAYAPLNDLRILFRTGGQILLTYDVFSSKEAFESPTGGRIGWVEIPLQQGPTPAVLGQRPELTPFVPAVVERVVIREPGTNGPDDFGEASERIVTPAVEPTYGPAPVIAPARPGVKQIIAENPDLFEKIRALADALAAAEPAFAGWVAVPSPYETKGA